MFYYLMHLDSLYLLFLSSVNYAALSCSTKMTASRVWQADFYISSKCTLRLITTKLGVTPPAEMCVRIYVYIYTHSNCFDS